MLLNTPRSWMVLTGAFMAIAAGGQGRVRKRSFLRMPSSRAEMVHAVFMRSPLTGV
jgi:hypothetical protein